MIESLDHVVLTVRDLDATVRFYVVGLGMQLVVALPVALQTRWPL